MLIKASLSVDSNLATSSEEPTLFLTCNGCAGAFVPMPTLPSSTIVNNSSTVASPVSLVTKNFEEVESSLESILNSQLVLDDRAVCPASMIMGTPILTDWANPS